MSMSDRGFASMTKAKRQAIARMGGIAAHELGTGHEWTSAEARAAGLKGGQGRARQIRAARAAETSQRGKDGGHE